MMTWINANSGTLIVGLLVAMGITAIVMHLYRNKKRGKTSCGCSCGACPMSGLCHEKK